MRKYIADCHFGHEGLNTRMDMRGFPSSDEMDAFMIRQWNSAVRKGDEVVILGDMFWNTDIGYAEGILHQLNGKKYMVLGNHDKAVRKKDFDTRLFHGIYDYREFSDDNRKVICSHYPMLYYNHQYRTKDGKDMTYMLCGHVHDTKDNLSLERHILEDRKRRTVPFDASGEEERNIPCRVINCFCMFSDYRPLTLDEWIEVTEKRLKERGTG